MSLRTVLQAKALCCPVARVRGEKEPLARCIGPDCILWRWQPIDAQDPRAQSAIQREIALMRGEVKSDEKPPHDETLRKRAVAKVALNVDGYVVRDENDKGYCGLGGVPS